MLAALVGAGMKPREWGPHSTLVLPNLPPGYSWKAEVSIDSVHLRLEGAYKVRKFVKTERQLRKHAARMADLAWLAAAVPVEEKQG